MSTLFSIVGIGLVAALLSLTMRQIKSEYSLLIGLATGFLILFLLMGEITVVLERMQSILNYTAMPGEYAVVLFKVLGICFVTQFACDACKDAGEGAIASKIETAGKITVLALCLPMFDSILSIVSSLIH